MTRLQKRTHLIMRTYPLAKYRKLIKIIKATNIILSTLLPHKHLVTQPTKPLKDIKTKVKSKT